MTTAAPRPGLAVWAALAVVGGGALLWAARLPGKLPQPAPSPAGVASPETDADAAPSDPSVSPSPSAQPEPSTQPGASDPVAPPEPGADASPDDGRVEVTLRVVDGQGQPVPEAEVGLTYFVMEGTPGPERVTCDAQGRAAFRVAEGTAFEAAPGGAGYGRVLDPDAPQSYTAEAGLALQFELIRLAQVRLVVEGDAAPGDAVEVEVLHAAWTGGEPDREALQRARTAVCRGGCGEITPGCLGGGTVEATPDAALRLTYRCRLGQEGIVLPVFPGRVSLTLMLPRGRRTTPLELELAPGAAPTHQVHLAD